MSNPLTHLGDLSIQDFLRDYWQKKPLLIRGAFADFEWPLDGDELAGLALEDEVESRLILEQGENPWELWRGPFTEEQFAELPPSHWTLLVQAVDQWVPEVRELLQRFRFLPDWRLDDVMVSYAPDQGSVGPHFDFYDVFLIQGAGKRRWRIGQDCDHTTPCRDDTPLKIVTRFDTTEEWLLEPGDMLYIPPGVAHWGIAEGESLTYSVGFRAPSHGDVLSELGAEIADTLSDAQRYSDAGLKQQKNPGCIDPSTIENLQAILQQHLTPENLVRWFGGYMTEPKYPELEYQPERTYEAADWQNDQTILERHPAARFAYFPQNDKQSLLFVDGLAYPCPLLLAECLCAHWEFHGPVLQTLTSLPDSGALVTRLLNQGSLVLLEN
jgi:50S ribosomal protein L16 3-hydroxylase